MTPTLIEFATGRRIVPYVRSPHAARYSKRVRRYHDSQNLLAMELRTKATLRLGRATINQRVRVGVAVYVQPVKGGQRKGCVPANIGDWDNYLKAALDCLVRHKFLIEDNASVFVGPGDVVLPASWGIGASAESGVYLRPVTADSAMPDVATVITMWPI